MEAMFSYLLRSFVISAIGVVYYCLFLRNKRFHHFNRFYLLSTGMISVVIPFMDFRWFSVRPLKYEGINNMLYAMSPGSSGGIHFRSSWEIALLLFYTGVSVILFTPFLARIGWILRVKRRHNPVSMGSYFLIRTDLEQAPFSYMNNLFWRNSIPLDDENGKKIFEHELTHIRQRHTYDKFFTRIIVSACWMNPFYWWLERELNMVHEFIADETSVGQGDVSAFAEMLLLSHNEGRFLRYYEGGYPDPFHSFFTSPVKRRLKMITSSATANHALLRRTGVIPLIFLVFMIPAFAIVKTGNNKGTDPLYRQQKLKNEKEQKLKDEKLAASSLRV